MKKYIKLLAISAMCFFALASCNPDEDIYFTAGKANFKMSATEVERDEPVTFTDLSVPLTGTQIVKWYWNFDLDKVGNTVEESTEQNPVYAFKAEGTYKVYFKITDSQGRTDFTSKTIKVITPYKELAHAEFTYPTEGLLMNTPLQFTDASIPSDGATITAWEWNFGDGDGSVSNEQNPTWSFKSSGSHTVTLAVTDSKGKTSTISHDLLIADPSDLISIEWKSAMLGAIENTVSPAMSSDGKTAYMWADQSAANAYDVVLKAFDVATGSEKWAYNVNNEFAALNPGAGVRLVYTSPSVGPNGDIYVCARDLKNSGAARKSFVLAITSSGTKRWSYALGIDGNFNYMTPAVDAKGNVYVGHLTNKPFEIAVLDPTTGAKTKSIALELGVRSGISLDKAGNVYFCSTGANGLFSYTLAGSMNWQYNTNFLTTGGDITIGADGTVYTVAQGASSGLVAAITSSGAAKWEFKLADDTPYGGVVLGEDGTVYANSGSGVHAIKADGSEKWFFATDGETVQNCVPLVDNRGYVHFITDKGTYYVVTANGALYAKKSLGDKSFASPVMNADGMVCIAAQEGDKSFLFGLKTGATGYANSAWPMKGQNPQRTHLQK